MNRIKIHVSRVVVLVVCGLLITPLANALDVSVSGFIRQEMAYKLNSDQNTQNPPGNPLNGSSLYNTAWDHPGSCVLLNIALGMANGCLVGAEDLPTLDKPKLDQESEWNVFATRAEVDFDVAISEDFSAFVKVRAYYQPDVFEDYGDVDHFGVDNHGKEATFLSVSDDNYMVDLPSAYIDYSHGPLWVRAGQQQIAWGEALFFRVADVANGLDLRRHFFLDLGAEEFADERLAAPGIRASYTLSDIWEVEVFAQMFQPTVVPARGSPYSMTPYPFSLDWGAGYDRVDDQINGGIRLRANFGDLGLQFFAVSRHNPDPIFRLIPGGLDLPGNIFNGPLPSPPFSGETLASQPFVQELTGEFGLNSYQDWFGTTTLAGLDGLQVLNSLVNDYPFIEDMFLVFSAFGLTDGPGNPHVTNLQRAYPIVGVFAVGFGGALQAGGEPVYSAEDIFGFGFNYIFYSDPDSFLDQLVLRFEASYTPDKEFTETGVSRNFIVDDEWVTSFILEKYHRFSQNFPATFMVFQWMHKSESDLLGRHLSGLGGDIDRLPWGGENKRGWDGLVLAFVQPLPNLTWRFDFSVLYDVNGGFFMQPAFRYKPNRDWTVEGFVNIVDADDRASIFMPMEWADDVTLRLTYQF